MQWQWSSCLQPLLLFLSLQRLLWPSSLVPYSFNVYPVGPLAWYLSWILFYVSHWNPYHARSQSSMYLSLFFSKTHASYYPAVSCRNHLGTVKGLGALFHTFVGLMSAATSFCVDANYKVLPALITMTSSACAAMPALAVGETWLVTAQLVCHRPHPCSQISVADKVKLESSFLLGCVACMLVCHQLWAQSFTGCCCGLSISPNLNSLMWMQLMQ